MSETPASLGGSLEGPAVGFSEKTAFPFERFEFLRLAMTTMCRAAKEGEPGDAEDFDALTADALSTLASLEKELKARSLEGPSGRAGTVEQTIEGLRGEGAYSYAEAVEKLRDEAESVLAALVRERIKMHAERQRADRLERALRDIIGFSGEWHAWGSHAIEVATAALAGGITAPVDRSYASHPLHYCITCGSPAGPGPGCGNCRQTGYDQTPCRLCAAGGITAGPPSGREGQE